MGELVTYTKGNRQYQYNTGRLWFIPEGTEIRWDGGQATVAEENIPVHPIESDEHAFLQHTFFSNENNVLVTVIQDDFKGAIQASNITDPNITFNVARADWDDMPGGVDWDPFVIWMGDDIQDECLLSYDYLVQFGDDYPQLQSIMLEMEMKNISYLWVY